MALVLKKLIEGYTYINDEISDPRSNDLILINPIVLTAICILYYKFVKDWGPRFMKDREPYKIEKIIMAYNVVQIVSCALFTYKSIELVIWSGYYNFRCQPISWEHTPMEIEIVKYVRYFFYLKLLDLMDTVFFVLRKKNNHISFLHVYHHIAMVFCGFLGLKYAPAGHGSMLAIVNCFVHSVMYTYYLLTVINPEYKKSIWWKKHLTQLQLVQFAYLLFHFTHPLFQADCTYPKWASMMFLPQNVFMTLMFSDFYYKEYIKKKQG